MTKLEQFEAGFAEAKAKYLEIMNGENDAAVLFKWIAENSINEWSVFHDGANGCSSLEGWVGMYHTLHHALYDDGDVTFVKTKGQGPRIMFYGHWEDNFEQLFMQRFGDDKMMAASFAIVGYMSTVQEFIAEYDSHEAEIEAMYERMSAVRRSKNV